MRTFSLSWSVTHNADGSPEMVHEVWYTLACRGYPSGVEADTTGDDVGNPVSHFGSLLHAAHTYSCSRHHLPPRLPPSNPPSCLPRPNSSQPLQRHPSGRDSPHRQHRRLASSPPQISTQTHSSRFTEPRNQNTKPLRCHPRWRSKSVLALPHLTMTTTQTLTPPYRSLYQGPRQRSVVAPANISCRWWRPENILTLPPSPMTTTATLTIIHPHRSQS